MAYLRISEARAIGQGAVRVLQKSASQVLTDASRLSPSTARYDVFLSHSYQDADMIYGVKKIIESLGLSVYVDWIDDPGLNRSQVTVKNAEVLRAKMRASSSLVYAHSPNSSDSAWMPWELGYFDSLKPSFVWILPLVVNYDSEFKGQEYLGLYPAIDKLEDFTGRLILGFTGVGEQRSTIYLTEAANGHGVFFKSS